MSARRVLLFASTTGYQIRSFGEAAADLGVRLVFASDRCDHLDDPWRDAAIPVRFHDIAASVRRIAAAVGDERPDGILAVGDRPTVLAAHAAAALGLPGNTPGAAARSRNKLAAREAFRAAGLLTPSFQRIAPDADLPAIAARCTFPAVVKPLALSGSRGVMRADREQDLVAAVHRVRSILRAPDVRLERDDVHDAVLVESFIPGREYAVEGVLTDGTFIPFAIFDKPDPLDGPFFEETIYVTPSRAPSPIQEAIIDAVVRAARALELRHGPVHAECRVNDAGVYVLEVAARPIGGLCSRALRFAGSGRIVSLEHVLVRHALGEPLQDVAREPSAAGVMMIPIPARGVFRGVAGEDAARAVPGIDEVRITAKVDALLVPLPEGRSYPGFIFARGAGPDDVEGALREAHRRLHFVIERELPVVAGS